MPNRLLQLSSDVDNENLGREKINCGSMRQRSDLSQQWWEKWKIYNFSCLDELASRRRASFTFNYFASHTTMCDRSEETRREKRNVKLLVKNVLKWTNHAQQRKTTRLFVAVLDRFHKLSTNSLSVCCLIWFSHINFDVSSHTTSLGVVSWILFIIIQLLAWIFVFNSSHHPLCCLQ